MTLNWGHKWGQVTLALSLYRHRDSKAPNYAWMGAKIIDNLSHDLQLSFPEMKGFSTRNLKYMRKFDEVKPATLIVANRALTH